MKSIESLLELADEVQALKDVANEIAEYEDALNEYYKPIEEAAKRIVGAAGFRTDTTHVQVPEAAMKQLFAALGMNYPGDK